MAKRDYPATPTVPEMLTVAEAARILRIGRTAAYELANRWLDTDGGEGMPARRIGRQIRVPTAELEEHYGIKVTASTAAIVTARPSRARPTLDSETVRSTGSRQRPASEPASQSALPFSPRQPREADHGRSHVTSQASRA
jgi:excisionase family DNA binding protein